MSQNKIVLITDLIDHKKRKEKELAYYQEYMEQLQRKLTYLRHEIDLTQCIINMVKADSITEIKK